MKKTFFILISSITSIVSILLCFNTPFFLHWQIIFNVSILLTFLLYILTFFIFQKLNKLFLTLNLVLNVIVILFVVFYHTGLLTHFSSFEDAKKWIESFGNISLLILFLIQIAQVVILPIPAQITTIAGVILFGAWKTFLISAFATIIGSFICFGIGRYLGVKIIYKIANKEVVDKYRNLLTQKGKLLLPIMFIFPAFPDDLLCFVAGSTNMTWKYFIITTLSTRLFGVGCMCFFGSGQIIPFHGWGIPVWIVIGIIMIISIFLILKHQEKIERVIIEKFSKIKNINNKNERV